MIIVPYITLVCDSCTDQQIWHIIINSKRRINANHTIKLKHKVLQFRRTENLAVENFAPISPKCTVLYLSHLEVNNHYENSIETG